MIVGMEVAERPCLVVGGGRIGARKALTLLDHGAQVTVVSPQLSARLQAQVAAGTVSWLQRSYESMILDEGYLLVIAATDEPSLNFRIAQDCKARGILHCIASSGKLSTVIFPASVNVDGLKVAVLSDGKSPSRSRDLRDVLSQALLERMNSQPRLGLFGARREDVGPEISELLAGHTDARLQENVREIFGSEEFFVLSTCQRLEFYFHSCSDGQLPDRLHKLLHEKGGPKTNWYSKTGLEAYYHLLRVVLGLDSAFVGETDIVGQVRAAARTRFTSNDRSRLKNTIDDVLAAGQEIRRQWPINGQDVSWAQQVCRIFEDRIKSETVGQVLLAGSGRLARQIGLKLAKRGYNLRVFTRRLCGHTERFCREIRATLHSRDQLTEFFPDANGLVLATTSSSPVFGLGDAMQLPRGSIVIDLGVPPNVALEVINALDGRYIGLNDIASKTNYAHNIKQQLAIAQNQRKAFEYALRWHKRMYGPQKIVRQARIGLRPSALSRLQTMELLQALLVIAPRLDVHLVTTETPGDRDKTTPLIDIAQDDFFTRGLDLALLEGAIDIALHSSKDVPSQLRPGLAVAAVTPSFVSNECLVGRNGTSLQNLPANSRVGVSSERRKKGILRLRPDLHVLPIRGNVEERIAQVDAGQFDAVVLAAVGLWRLGLEHRISQWFTTDEFPPPPGQGSLALIVRDDNPELINLLKPLDLGERTHLQWTEQESIS